MWMQRESVLRASLVALLLAFLVSGIYAAWWPQSYTGDDLQYALVIKRAVSGKTLYHPEGTIEFAPQSSSEPGQRPAQVPSNPRYLLDWPTTILFARAAYALGWAGDPLPLIQIWHLLAGLGGLICFYFTVYLLTRDTAISVISSAGLALSFAYWTYSTHLDHGIVATAIASFAVLAFTRFAANTSSRGGRRWLLAMAAALSLAVLYNVASIVIVPAFVVAWLLSPQEPAAASPQRIALSVLAWVALTAGVALLLVLAFVRPSSLSDLLTTITYSGAPETGVALPGDLIRAVIGFGRSIVSHQAVVVSVSDFWARSSVVGKVAFVGLYGLVTTAFLLILALHARWNDRRTSVGKLSILVAVWLLADGLFNVYWDPGYIKYWLVTLVPAWLAVALVLHLAMQHRSSLRRVSLAATTAFIIAALALNLTVFQPASVASNNEWLQIASQLREASSPASLFVSASPDNPLDFYLAYFGERDIVSIPLVGFGSRGDQTRVDRVIAAHVEQHRAVGGPIYVYGVEQLSPADVRRLTQQLGGNGLRVAWTFGDVTIHQVVP